MDMSLSKFRDLLMDREAWRVVIYGVAKNRTRLSDWTELNWTVVLKKTLESPLDCKEMKPFSPKGNHPWIFIGRTDAEAEALIFGYLMQRVDSLEKTLMLGKIEAGREGDDRGWDGRMASPTKCTWVWINSIVGDGQGGLACYSPWGRKESDSTEWLNWTELR